MCFARWVAAAHRAATRETADCRQTPLKSTKTCKIKVMLHLAHPATTRKNPQSPATFCAINCTDPERVARLGCRHAWNNAANTPHPRVPRRTDDIRGS